MSDDVLEANQRGHDLSATRRAMALLRAAAKNYQDVAVLSSPKDYEKALKEMEEFKGDISIETRREFSLKAFEHTAHYDSAISEKLKNEEKK